MKLHNKLSFGFLIVAVSIIAVNVVLVRQARVMKARVDNFTQSSTPILTALGQSKAAGLRMVSAAQFYAAEPSAAVEEEFRKAKAEYEQFLAIFQGLAADKEQLSLADILREAGKTLSERGNDLISLAKSQTDPATLRPAQEALHETQRRFMAVINKPLAAQLVDIKEQRQVVSYSVQRSILLSQAAAVIVLILAVALGVFLAGTIASPIERLAKDVQVVGEGDLTRRTAIRAGDEVGQLADAFNRMAENLQRTTVSKRYVDNIITSMVDALVVSTTDGNIRSVNKATRYLLGYTEQELVGHSVEVLFGEDRHNDAVILSRSRFDEVLAKGSVSNVERTWVSKDGRRIPVLFSGAVMRDDKSQIQGVVCVAVDITERKRAEEALQKAYADLQKAQQQLVQSEKLSALGRFSAGIAHEVKNPLGIILGGSEFLLKKLSTADEDTRTTLEMISNAVHRADVIVRDLLKFARPSAANKEAVSPAVLVDGTIALLKYGGSLKRVTAETRYAHRDTLVEVDKNQLQQVLLNIMMNAVDAMPNGGSITVTTAVEQAKDQGLCLIRVADSGEGIAPADLSKLFEPFYTTKRDKKGTGLGLSISKTIVESHGGTIGFESELGKGTTVTVALPVRAEGGKS